MAIGAAVFVGYLILAVLVFWHVWASGHPSSMVACTCEDPSNEIWDFGWMPYALGHGLNPFLTNRLLFPTGANLVDNAAFFLPAFALSPITVLFGPVMTYGVAGTLGPALSAWCAYLMVRHFKAGYVPATMAGLFYGFSPFVMDNLPFGHANLTWFFFPPLLVIVLDNLIVRQERSPLRHGVLLGLVMAGQFYTGAEVMVLCVLIGALAIAYLVLTNPGRFRTQWLYALKGLAIGAALCAVLIAYPVVIGLTGPEHYSAAPWSFIQYGVSPTHLVTLSSLSHRTLGFPRPGGNLLIVVPDTNYLGPALAILLAAGLIRRWRDRVLRFGIVLFAVCTVLAIGIPSEPPGHSTPWTPWRLFVDLPVFRQVTANHFDGMATLFVALALGIVLDHFRQGSTSWLDKTRTRFRRAQPLRVCRSGAVASVVVAGIGVGVLMPVASAMSLPLAMQRNAPPAWFAQKAALLRASSTLLVLPYASSAYTDAMVWQADADFSFRQVGGFQLVPGPNGQVDHSPPGAAGALLSALSGSPLTTLPKATPANLGLVRSTIRSHGVNTVVVTPVAVGAPYAVGFLSAVLGEVPHKVAGSWVWSDVERDRIGPRAATGARLASCAGSSRDPMRVASCVLHRNGTAP
jgi:hypothetical protein